MDESAGQERSGGDIGAPAIFPTSINDWSFASATEVRRYIGDSRGLKADIIQYLRNYHYVPAAHFETNHSLELLASQNGLRDVILSQYETRTQCRDTYGIEHDAVTTGPSTTAEKRTICYNPARLFVRGARRYDIVALGTHEQAHHFGFVDSEDLSISYPIIQYVKDTVDFVFGSPLVATERVKQSYVSPLFRDETENSDLRR